MPVRSPVKRAVDLGLCLGALPLALPICLLLMVAIRIESAGSPLFVQRRIGRDHKVFRMLKLRTMAANTGDHPSHYLGGAAITRLGRLLRTPKLDELPQLLNVIAGSMSLVGPRPCMPSQQELIDERAKRGLLALAPGITGPGQLERVNMSEPVRLAAIEADYFARSTVWDDLRLIVRTALGGGKGDAAHTAGR